MDTVEKISTKRRIELTNANVGQREPEEFRFSASALTWGISAGITMAVYLILLHASSASSSVAMKFVKYLFLFGFIGWGLWKYRFVDRTQRFFRRAILLTAMISFYAAATLSVISFVVGLVAPEFSFDKFGMTIDSLFDQFIMSGALLIEVFALGMVGGLIWLQYLKWSVPGEEA